MIPQKRRVESMHSVEADPAMPIADPATGGSGEGAAGNEMVLESHHARHGVLVANCASSVPAKNTMGNHAGKMESMQIRQDVNKPHAAKDAHKSSSAAQTTATVGSKRTSEHLSECQAEGDDVASPQEPFRSTVKRARKDICRQWASAPAALSVPTLPFRQVERKLDAIWETPQISAQQPQQTQQHLSSGAQRSSTSAGVIAGDSATSAIQKGGNGTVVSTAQHEAPHVEPVQQQHVIHPPQRLSALSSPTDQGSPAYGISPVITRQMTKSGSRRAPSSSVERLDLPVGETGFRDSRRVEKDRNGTFASTAQHAAGEEQPDLQQQMIQLPQHPSALDPPTNETFPEQGISSVSTRHMAESEPASRRAPYSSAERLDLPDDEPRSHSFLQRARRWAMKGIALARTCCRTVVDFNPRAPLLAVRNFVVRMLLLMFVLSTMHFMCFVVLTTKQMKESLDVARTFDEMLENTDLFLVEAEGGPASPDLAEILEDSGQLVLSRIQELQHLMAELQDSAIGARGDVEHSQWLTDDVNEYALGASQGLGGRSEAASAQGLLVGEQEQEQARDDSERWFMEVSASIWAELNELKDTYKNILIWLKPGTPKVFIRKDMEQLADYVRDTMSSPSASMARVHAREMVQERLLTETTEKVHRDNVEVSSRTRTVSVHHGSSPGLSMQTSQPPQSHLAERNEVLAPDVTKMANYASIRTGAEVVRGSVVDRDGHEELLTSECYTRTSLNWFNNVPDSRGLPKGVYAKGPEAALSTDDNSARSYFAFKGGVGRLTVQLSPPRKASHSSASGMTSTPPGTRSVSLNGQYPQCSSIPGSIPCSKVDRDLRRETSDDMGNDLLGYYPGGVKVTHVSLEHTLTAATHSTKSAPGVFRVLGWVDDPSKNALVKLGGGGAGMAEDGTLRPYVLVDRAEFTVGEGASKVQTFSVSDAAREATPPVRWVTLEIKSNHGAPRTCLYGFRVHGDGVALPL